MHHYPFHVGDYCRETYHLSHLEDLAYRRLLDRYYSDEQPPTGDPETVALRISMPQAVDAVATVLEEFFHAQGDAPAWTHRRADAEIQAYQSKREGARRAAATRWAAKA